MCTEPEKIGKFPVKVFFLFIVWTYFKAQRKNQSLETMTHTVNLPYYQRLEMAENPKRIAESGILTNAIICQLVRWLSWRSQLCRVRKCFEGQKDRQSLEMATCLLSLSRSPFSLYSSSLSLNMVLVQANRIPCQTKSKSKPNWDSNTIGTCCYCILQKTEG